MASDYNFETFTEQHKMQLVMSGVPSHFWPVLHEKLRNETFDAGDYFSMIFQDDGEDDVKCNKFDAKFEDSELPAELDCEDETEKLVEKCRTGSLTGSGSQCSKWKVVVCDPNGILKTDPSKIFLIDHAWTFKPHDARKHLTHVPGLLGRMTSLLDMSERTTDTEQSSEVFDEVLARLWMYSQTYTLNKDDLSLEEKLSVWYIMDEFGSRIRHHDEPKFRVVPFYFIPQQILYSLLFPIADSVYGDEVSRDFVEGTSYHRSAWRDFYLLPWFPKNFTQIPAHFYLPKDEYFEPYEPVKIDLKKACKLENFPSVEKVFKVYTEIDQIVKNLTHPTFTHTQEMDDADILWLQSHFKNFNLKIFSDLISKKPHVMVNQFPCESVLTVKSLLAACVHLFYQDFPMNEKTMDFHPAWFCTTFNLRCELPQFISYFQKREENDLDNTWVVKPWNLARSLDTFVTNDLSQIIRLIDSGPKLACKYIEDPVLFHRSDVDSWVKYDLRFIVFLRSVRPLQLYVYDGFWLRFALKEFTLDNFDDFEKHFTVFNYLDKDKILQMRCEEFIDKFSRQYPSENWIKVQDSINEAIKETFRVATAYPPPKGLAPVPQCRAMYGLDVMLKWSHDMVAGKKCIQPVVLEVNYMPDCARACEYYPDFANTVFLALFAKNLSDYKLPITQLF